jgi:hypothetical protein
MSLIKVDPTKVQAKINKDRIAELKQLLRDTDYVGLSDYDKEKTELVAQRKAWRDELRTLEPN